MRGKLAACCASPATGATRTLRSARRTAMNVAVACIEPRRCQTRCCRAKALNGSVAPRRGERWLELRRASAASSKLKLGSLSRLLLNQPIRPKQQRLGERDAKSFRGLEVDHQLEARRLLHGHVGRIRA